MSWDSEEDDNSDDPDVNETDPLYAAPLLSVAEERALFAEYARTHDAAIRDRLILANTRWVRQLAWGFARRHRLESLTVEDLIGYGMFGLMTAIEKFDATAGYKFSTYATSWIRQAISRAVEDRDAMIREPSYVQVARRKAYREGRESDVAPAWDVLSLDRPVRDDESNDPLGDFVASDAPALDETATERQLLRETLYVALERLKPRERLVIALRYGLGDDAPLTLEESGRLLGVTRERVRQIEGKALTGLRLHLRETAEGEVALRMLTLVEQARTAKIRKAAAVKRTRNIERLAS